MLEGLEECDYARERCAGLEMLLLPRGDFGEVFFGGDGQLGPVEEDFAGCRSWSALELGFDVPWEVRSAVFVENFVGAYRIFVF